MRVSTRKNDEGYRKNTYFYRAYLDGEELKHCHTADEEKGEAHCFVYDDNGRPVPSPIMDGEIKTEIKYGDVRIKKKWFYKE